LKVSFIGIGRMGLVMATRLLDAGHELTVYNRSPEKTAALASRGASVAKSVAEACSRGGPVITMLADDAALKSLTTEAGGIVASLPGGGIHVAMGTHQIDTIRELAQVHSVAAQEFVAAPVVGRPAVAAAGQLGIIAAGSAAAISKLQPLFDAIGRRTFNAGSAPNCASLLKLCNNLVLACAIEAMGESFALVEKAGASASCFREVLTDGLFRCLAYDSYSRAIVDRTWDQVNLTATLGLKDVKLVLAVAESLGVPLPSARVCRDHLLSALAAGDAARDWSVMALQQARSSGLDWGTAAGV
jgi:3-hydroxyisobutyrate dehydrogenase-like beta-hydroxyacid dehydrogenase